MEKLIKLEFLRISIISKLRIHPILQIGFCETKTFFCFSDQKGKGYNANATNKQVESEENVTYHYPHFYNFQPHRFFIHKIVSKSFWG